MATPAGVWWRRFWLAPTEGAALGLIRIGFGVLALGWAAGRAPILVRVYSDAGELPIGGARLWGGEWISRWGMLDALGGAGATFVLYVAMVAALLAVVMGFRTRLALVCAWLLVAWFQFRNPTYMDGGDDLLRITAFHLVLGHLVLSPCSRPLSLDRWLEGYAGTAWVPVWTVRLFQFHLVAVVLASAFATLGSEVWWDGSALVYALSDPSVSRFGLPGLFRTMPVAAAVTVLVLAWRVLFPPLVILRATRPWALAVGVLIHVAMFASLDLGVMPLVVLLHLVAFVNGRTWRRVGDVLRLRGAWWRGSGMAGAASPGKRVPHPARNAAGREGGGAEIWGVWPIHD